VNSQVIECLAQVRACRLSERAVRETLSLLEGFHSSEDDWRCFMSSKTLENHATKLGN